VTPRELDLLVEKTIGRLWRELLRAVADAKAGNWLATVERYLLVRNIEATVRAVDDTAMRNALARMITQLSPIREAAWDAARTSLPAPLQAEQLVRVSWARHALERPDTQQAIREADLRRIQGITTEGEAALREAISRGIANGTHPTKLAREIRDMIGLTRQQAEQVERYRTRLEGEGRKPDQVDRMVAKFAAKKLRQRAETIARTEVMRAQSEGRRLQWARLVAEGTLNPAEWEREWVTSRLEMVCKICAPFHGERAEIGGSYTSRDGVVSVGPIQHPNCMCIERLVPRGFRRGQPATAARDRLLEQLGRRGR
jgi:hypothetical protein